MKPHSDLSTAACDLAKNQSYHRIGLITGASLVRAPSSEGTLKGGGSPELYPNICTAIFKHGRFHYTGMKGSRHFMLYHEQFTTPVSVEVFYMSDISSKTQSF